MSMCEYGYSDYGMIIDDVAEKEILKRGGYEDLDELWEDGRCQYVSEFSGTAYRLNEHGDCSWSEDYLFSNDRLFYFNLGKEPSLCRQAYSSVDEIVEELKNDLSDLLPDDFDIRSRLCFIAGTYWG